MPYSQYVTARAICAIELPQANCLIRRSPQPPCTILLNRCFDQDVNFTTNVSQRVDRKTSSARARIRF